MKIQVTIVILNWNGLKNTFECLESLKHYLKPSYKVIVIDNGSKINEGELIKIKYGFANVFRLKSNLGYTGGCNYAIRKAIELYDPPYILLLNNDTLIKSDFITPLLETAKSDKMIGIVGSKLVDYYSKKINYSGGDINWIQAKPYRFTDNNNEIRKVKIITGCSMLIKREVIKKVGMLDDRFFAYFEDSIFCIKAQAAGFYCVYNPSSVVYHKEQGSTGHKSKIYIYLMTRNRILFVRYYTNLLYKIYFFIFITVKLFLIAIYYLLTNQHNLAYAISKGYIDGYLNLTGKPRI